MIKAVVLATLCLLFVFSATNLRAESGKDVLGRTIKLKDKGSTGDFKFNIPTFLPAINRVTTIEVNNGRQLVEKYYVGSSLVGTAVFASRGGFNSSSSTHFSQIDSFIEKIKKNSFYTKYLIGSTTEKFT